MMNINRTFYKAVIFTLASGVLMTPPLIRAESTEKSDGIRVTGEGVTKIIPDQVLFRFSVETRDMNLNKATTENDKRVKQLLADLKKFRVDDTDIQVDRIYIAPEYSFAGRKREFTGYRVAKNFNILVRNLDIFGDLNESVLQAGVENVQGITYESSKKKELEKEARKKAMLDAHEKADDMARAIGQRVGKALSIIELDGPHAIPMHTMAMRAEAAPMGDAPPPLMPGEIEIKSRVSVTFSLE